MEPTILLVEPDENYKGFLKKLLSDCGYKVLCTNSGSEALSLLESSSINIIVAEFNLPDMRGDSFYEAFHKEFPELSAIFLSTTADTEIIKKIIAHRKTDFMVKPIVNGELLARIAVYLENGSECTDEEPGLKVRDLELDAQTFRAIRGNTAVYLSPTEFKLLKYLITNKNRVLTREMILNRVWEYTFDVSSRIVDVYIGYLREKLENKGESELIETVRGFGYRIKE